MLRLGHRVVLLAFFGAIISGCASYGPSQKLIGKSRAEVVAIMGPPTQQKSLQDGTRLVYARGPYGLHTYMIDFNRSDVLTQWKQVLHEKNFESITPGMSGQEVEAIIGPSLEKSLLGRSRGEVWSYRFENSLCIWFQVELDKQLLVRSAGYGIPPECARDDDRVAGIGLIS
ncbi:MAG: hypothetical protein ACO3DD_02670 [Burkholderiaceae bacterium]